MLEERIYLALDKLTNALNRLEEALAHPVGPDFLERDGTIQRFEFCFEQFWKTLKLCLESEGIIASSPKSCLQAAFKANWIDNESFWLKMLEDRNLTSHTYKAELAEEIYQNIKKYYPELRRISEVLKEK